MGGTLNSCCGGKGEVNLGEISIEKNRAAPSDLIFDSDIIEKHLIKGTAYQLIKTKKQKYGLIR